MDGTPYDFRRPRRLGDLEIDHAFTDLARDGDGRALLRLHGSDGLTAQLWVDPRILGRQAEQADVRWCPRGPTGPPEFTLNEC